MPAELLQSVCARTHTQVIQQIQTPPDKYKQKGKHKDTGTTSRQINHGTHIHTHTGTHAKAGRWRQVKASRGRQGQAEVGRGGQRWAEVGNGRHI